MFCTDIPGWQLTGTDQTVDTFLHVAILLYAMLLEHTADKNLDVAGVYRKLIHRFNQV